MTSEQKFPIGWLALVTDLRLTLMREFPGLSVLEMNGDRGWLHVRCDDRDLAPAERIRLDRMIQNSVTRSLATCMSCSCGHGRDREGRREVTCDACEAGSDMCDAPSEAELETAPLIEGWELQGATFFGKRQQIHGWFFQHPEIGEGHYGHSSLVVEIDKYIPPRWARCETRIYRFGCSYRPAEREIRLTAHRLRQQPLTKGEAPGGSADVQALWDLLQVSGNYENAWLAKLWQAYLMERMH